MTGKSKKEESGKWREAACDEHAQGPWRAVPLGKTCCSLLRSTSVGELFVEHLQMQPEEHSANQVVWMGDGRREDCDAPGTVGGI